MSASCAAGTTDFLETNTETVCASAVCTITEQYFGLRDSHVGCGNSDVAILKREAFSSPI